MNKIRPFCLTFPYKHLFNIPIDPSSLYEPELVVVPELALKYSSILGSNNRLFNRKQTPTNVVCGRQAPQMLIEKGGCQKMLLAENKLLQIFLTESKGHVCYE